MLEVVPDIGLDISRKERAEADEFIDMIHLITFLEMLLEQIIVHQQYDEGQAIGPDPAIIVVVVVVIVVVVVVIVGGGGGGRRRRGENAHHPMVQ